MTLIDYDPRSTIRSARDRYFTDNGFGANGGYDEPWVDVKVGPIPFPFPNTKSRVRAVRFHDLHHIVTGYRTDLTGEFEISAWEIAAGCKDATAAWALNLAGMAGGVVTAPRRTWQAFVRGRASDTLYGRDYEALLSRTVADVRDDVGIGRSTRASARDAVLFAAAVVAGFAVGGALTAAALPALPFGLVAMYRKRRRPYDTR